MSDFSSTHFPGIERGELVFFHSPNTRSTGTHVLLEELGAGYDRVVLDMKHGENRKAPYLAVNPLGKVPAIVHDGALVTEQGAVYCYLADLFPEAGLAPAIGDARRGPYLRWLFYYGSCFEPALVDKSRKLEPAPPSTSPYSDYDAMLGALVKQLEKAPYLTGDRMTAADVLWGVALHWTTMFKLVPEVPALMAFKERITSRPAYAKVAKIDQALAAAHAAKDG